ncbi:MAG: 30S ribosomal protein S6 [Candidatus Zixiibacteriota bacterium]
MRVYETVFILDPSLDEHTVEKEIKKVEDLITGQKGKIVKTEKWGTRRLAYPIQKKMQGHYTLIYFEGDGNIPTDLERAYKLNESCLRYLTVVSEAKTEEAKVAEKREDRKPKATFPESTDSPKE